ncbi:MULTISPECIES: hypothetical protein [unclassified Streptomyces]|uniref:hypothetical protein n=1 Tax=unclassified Streptomyces TaxID=2593676 RepID=UPI004040FEF6
MSRVIRRRRLAAMVLMAVGVTACGSGYGQDARDAKPAGGRALEHTPAPEQAPPTAVHKGTGTAAQLEDQLLSAPVGSKPDRTNGLLPRTALSLDQFARGLFVAKSLKVETGYLREQGFTYAAETNWDAADGTGAEIFLIKFRGSAGARHYTNSVGAATGSSTSALAGVPDGYVLTASSKDSYGDVIMQARFAVGDIAVDMHYYSHATADRSGLNALAQAQYTRLIKSTT